MTCHCLLCQLRWQYETLFHKVRYFINFVDTNDKSIDIAPLTDPWGESMSFAPVQSVYVNFLATQTPSRVCNPGCVNEVDNAQG